MVALSHCLGPLIAGMGFALVVLALRQMRRTQASRAWLIASGRVTSAEVKKRPDPFWDSPRDYFYSAEISYRYKVGEVEYEAKRIAHDGNRQSPESIVARYSTGSTVSVYYDPENHAEAVLEPGANLRAGCLVVGVGIVFMVTGTVATIGAWLG